MSKGNRLRENLSELSATSVGQAAGRVFKRLAEMSAVAAAGAKDAGDWIVSMELVGRLNESFSSAVSKAMDADFLDKGIGHVVDGMKMMPNNHRILDGGHTISASLDRAFEVGQREGLSGIESFSEWAKAYLTDLSSPAGMPVPGAKSIYHFLQDTMGLSEERARDFVTVNGAEAVQALLSGAIAAFALVFAWRTEDKEQFSRVLGSIGISSLIALNPAAALVAVAGLAMGYQKKIVNPEGLKRGAVVGSVSIFVSAIIPGPILLGAIPAIVLSIYLQKNLKTEVPVEQQMKDFVAYLRSPEFRVWVNESWAKSKERIEGLSAVKVQLKSAA